MRVMVTTVMMGVSIDGREEERAEHGQRHSVEHGEVEMSVERSVETAEARRKDGERALVMLYKPIDEAKREAREAAEVETTLDQCLLFLLERPRAGWLKSLQTG